MAITIITTSWLGYEAETGKLLFWDGARFRPLAEAAGYALVVHTHAISDVSGLQAALDAKLPTSGGAVSGTITAAGFNTAGIVAAAQVDIGLASLTTWLGQLYFEGAKVWTQDNDGAGSGLDADQLDGHDSGYFTDIVGRLGYTPFNSAGGTIGGNVTIAGTTTLTGGGRLKSQQAFIANGTWTKPAGVRWIMVHCLGGGGGGGGAQGGASNGACGGGGGAGGYAIKWIDVSAISSVPVTVGAGGAAGSDTGGNGGTGGTSSFGTHCSADGGIGGAGQSAGNFAQIVAGGYGGNASGGDFNFTGGAGAPGIRLDFQNGIAGRGAAAALVGGGGNGYAGNSNGQQGIARGDGGGGGVVANSATGRSGGAGSTGLVWVWEYE